jgi:hypothetical protein
MYTGWLTLFVLSWAAIAVPALDAMTERLMLPCGHYLLAFCQDCASKAVPGKTRYVAARPTDQPRQGDIFAIAKNLVEILGGALPTALIAVAAVAA